MQRRPHPRPHRLPPPAPSANAEGVYLVPPDSVGGPVRLLSSDELQAFDARTHTVQDIVAIASLLAKVPKFPLDVIDTVLEFADFFVTFDVESNEHRRGQNDMNEVYVGLQLPQATDVQHRLPPGVNIALQCVDLVAECSSHDQGWASQDNQHDHTYTASYTWSEIAVVKRITSQDEDGSHTTEAEAARTPITVNVRADRQARHHLKEFKDPLGLVGQIKLGDSVQLILRSQYPGWTNSAEYGRLRARFALDICEDAQLLSWKQLHAYAQETGRSDTTPGGNSCNVQ